MQLTVEIDNQLDQGNMHGSGSIYSDWCFSSEVQFDYLQLSISCVGPYLNLFTGCT